MTTTHVSGQRNPPLGSQEVARICVVPLDEIGIGQGWRPLTRMVVQATGQGMPRRVVIARLAVLRRLLRAGGGDLVLAADADVAAALRRRGLHWTVASHGDPADAISVLRDG